MSFRTSLPLLALALALSHCKSLPQGAPDNGWELRTYDVPSDVGPELVSALQNLFWVGKDLPKTAQATLAPNGQVLVTAPHGYFTGIDTLVATTASKKMPQPASIQLTYWAVIGSRADKPHLPPELQPIASVLDVIAKSQGALSFTALETLSIRAMSGRGAHTEGAQLRIDQTASERDGTVVADMDIRQQRPQEGPRGRIETRVKIQAGQTVVLGQSGYVGADSKEPASVFYIVRADVEAR